MVPFSACNIVIIIITEISITFKTIFYSVRPLISAQIIIRSQFTVYSHSIIHFIKIGHGLYRKKYQFFISIFQLIGQNLKLAISIGFQCQKFVCHRLKLPVGEIVSPAIEHLGSHSRCIFTIQIQNTSCFCSIFLSELLFTEVTGIILQIISIKTFRIPSHIQEEVRRKLIRFQIAHIQDPHSVYTIGICQI